MLGKFIFNKIYLLRRFDVWSINNNVSTRISKLIYNHDPIWLLNCMGSRQWNTLCKVWSRDSQSDIQKRKTWHPTVNFLFLWQKGKNEKARSVIKFILKFKRQPGGQSKHDLMLLWFKKFYKCNQDVTIHKPNVSILLSSAFIRDDLIAATRGCFYMLTK